MAEASREGLLGASQDPGAAPGLRQEMHAAMEVRWAAPTPCAPSRAAAPSSSGLRGRPDPGGARGGPAASQVGAFRRGLEQRLGGCTRLVTARKSPLAPSPSSCPTRTTVLLLATGSRGPAATAGARRCPTERLASTPDEGVGYPVGYSQEWTGPLGPPARADPSAGAPCSQPSPREAGQPGDLG